MRRREFIVGIGGAAAWPLAVRAQQQAIPVVGALNTPAIDAASFQRGLSEQGYTDGRNVTILYRSAEFRNDRWSGIAADLVKLRVAVIAAFGTAEAVAAKSVTSTIPIVFITGSDPIELGLVASLSHPGGNVTGVTFLAKDVTAKRLALLHQIVPEAASIGHLVNRSAPPAAAQIREAETAARELGVHLVLQNANMPNDIDAAFAILAEQKVGALLVDASELFARQRNQIAALAARYSLPAIYHTQEIVRAGGLISYAGSLAEQLHVFGIYIGRVLKGEKPGDLPVQQPTRFELAINLKTARALGLTVPNTLLAVADEVIE